MTSNSFCRHLSNGCRIYIQNGKVTWHPCCQWQGQPFEWHNHQQQRKTINIDVPWHHAQCHRCRDEEAYKDSGYRLAGNRVIPELSNSKLGWLDIQADVTCNGGCLICGPWSSSYWQTELAKHGEYQLQPMVKNLRDTIDKVLLDLDLSELRLLQFLGGEPFLSEIDGWVIPRLTHPEQCTLKYTTNGSVYPRSERMTHWSKFQSVIVNFSIDGIGSRFEYLRYPLQWHQVQANIARMISETGTNVRFHINHTVTPLNIWYYNEFLEWVEKTFPKDRFSGIHCHTAYGVMSVAATQPRIRNMVQTKFGTDHALIKMLEDNPWVPNKFDQWVNTWDHRRGTNWRTVFEEIA